MGSFNTQCAISKRNIEPGERIVRIYYRVNPRFKDEKVFTNYHSNQFNGFEYFPPIKGTYSDYGKINADASMNLDIVSSKLDLEDLPELEDILFLDIDEKIYDFLLKKPFSSEYEKINNWKQALKRYNKIFREEIKTSVIRSLLFVNGIDIVPNEVYEYLHMNISSELVSLETSSDKLLELYDLYEDTFKLLYNLMQLNLNITHSIYGSQEINHNLKDLYQNIIDNWPSKEEDED